MKEFSIFIAMNISNKPLKHFGFLSITTTDNTVEQQLKSNIINHENVSWSIKNNFYLVHKSFHLYKSQKIYWYTNIFVWFQIQFAKKSSKCLDRHF